MRCTGLPAVEERLVAVVEVRAPQHERVLQPDERLPPDAERVEALGEGQEVGAGGSGDVPNGAGLTVLDRVLEGSAEQLLERRRIERVILDGQGVLRASDVADTIWRVAPHEGGQLAREQLLECFGARRIAAKQAVAAEDPQVAAARRRGGGERAGSGIFSRGLREFRSQVSEQLVDLGIVEAGRFDFPLGPQRFEEASQGRQVPLGKFGRAVEGDAERGGLQVVDVELDDVALAPAQRAHRLQAAVAADHPAGWPMDDERLGLAEALQARLDRVEVALVVGARVGGVGVQGPERDAADRKGLARRCVQVSAPRDTESPVRDGPDLELGLRATQAADEDFHSV